MAIVSRFVVTVSRTATVMDAIHAMAGAKVGSVVVVDGDAVTAKLEEADQFWQKFFELWFLRLADDRDVRHGF